MCENFKNKEIKLLEEREYINELGQLVRERVVEVRTRVIIEKDNIDENERRRMYYQLKKSELNEDSRRRKNRKYEEDAEFREKIRIRNRENYLKRKMKKNEE